MLLQIYPDKKTELHPSFYLGKYILFSNSCIQNPDIQTKQNKNKVKGFPKIPIKDTELIEKCLLLLEIMIKLKT